MQRRRTIAGPPVRSSSHAWEAVVQLIVDTLTMSPAVSADDIARGFEPLAGLGPALIAAGHLEVTPILLVDTQLHLSILVPTGAAALGVEENLNPVPGGTSSTDGWILHLPSPPTLLASLTAAAMLSPRISLDAPAEPTVTKNSSSTGSIDVAALDKLRESS